MSREPDGWAKSWLERMRSEGSKGLTIEKKGNSHYVYWATTVWVPETRSRRKVSEYIGILEPPGNLVLSSDIDVESMDPRAIAAARIDVGRYRKRREEVISFRIRGPMMVLMRFGGPLLDALREHFPLTCDDLFMLACARLSGRGRLCQAGGWFERQDNVMCLNPHRDPETLSAALRLAGGDAEAQNRFFGSLAVPGKRMAADLTFCFSRGRAYLIKKGYNRFRLSCGQFNMAVICGLDDGLPQSLKTLPGNVREGSIVDILRGMDIGTDCVLVMDRGYFSEGLMDELHLAGYRFVLPVRRDSALYGTVHVDPGTGFLFRGDSVLCGMGEGHGFNAYRFENQRQRNTELAGMMWDGAAEEGEPAGYALDGDPSKAGNLILVTNLNEDPRELYTMFKLRCSVEECFDAAKNVLSADSTYLRDNLSIMGYNLVTFIALRMHMAMEAWIASKGMTSRYSPSDMLYECASVVSVVTQDRVMTQPIPANVSRVEEDLGLGLFLEGGQRLIP